MTLAKIPVTVVVPVRNEEANLPRCLMRLAGFEQVVVVDSSSIDRTKDIAREFGAHYVNFEWNGQYPKKRNWFLMNHKVPTEWILFLDADEFIGDDFMAALPAAIANPANSGFWLAYTNHFMGRRLNYGLPQRKLALFRTGRGLFERIEEDRWSSLDMEVHEHPIIDGKVGEIKVPIDHDDDRGLSKFIEKHTDYARWEARRNLLMRSAPRDGSAIPLTLRQRTKYRFITAWWYPAGYFLYAYVIRLGFLDGRAGFVYAAMKFWYFTLIQSFTAEFSRRAE